MTSPINTIIKPYEGEAMTFIPWVFTERPALMMHGEALLYGKYEEMDPNYKGGQWQWYTTMSGATPLALSDDPMAPVTVILPFAQREEQTQHIIPATAAMLIAINWMLWQASESIPSSGEVPPDLAALNQRYLLIREFAYDTLPSWYEQHSGLPKDEIERAHACLFSLVD